MEPKRQLLLEAALKLFSRHGYRRTSVDDIAQEAGVAKGTVYVYFNDKEALFKAVVEYFAEQLDTRTLTALKVEDRPDKILRALLEAKFLHAYRIILSAPHAQELIDSGNLLAKEAVDRCTETFRCRMETFISDQLLPAYPHLKRVGSVKDLINVLLSGGDGLCRHVESEKELIKLLGVQVRMLIGGNQS
jgi:AcrR family transcriptional regulator